MSEEKGVFTLSLDTELAWGTFDVGRVERFEEAYLKTPEVIERLCTLFEEYRIPATWALVSHLLVDCEGGTHDANRVVPEFEWIDDWFSELPCVSGLDRELWYAPWLVDQVQSCETDQEIGLHGATHMQLGADGCSRRCAEEEVESAVETLQEYGVKPESFVFPRNDVGHLDVLNENGIRAVRGVDARWYERKTPQVVKPPLRLVDEVVRRSPPVVEPVVHDGIVEIPGSQVFRPSHSGWQYTPSGSSITRAKKGLRDAARSGGVFHLWFHPFNLGHAPERDLQRLEKVLAMTRELVDQGELDCLPMGAIARQVPEGRWQ